MQDKVVIPIRRAGSIMQVVRAGQVKGRLVVRVLVHGPGGATPLPMAVTLPCRCPVPGVGSVVVFGGLRVELVETGGRMRSIVRADRLGEVAGDAAA